MDEQVAFNRYLATREKPDEEWLPSKKTCISYTLLVCGHGSDEADQIIDQMIQDNKRLDNFMAREEWAEFMKSIGR